MKLSLVELTFERATDAQVALPYQTTHSTTRPTVLLRRPGHRILDAAVGLHPGSVGHASTIRNSGSDFILDSVIANTIHAITKRPTVNARRLIERGIRRELAKMMMKCIGHNIGDEN